MNYSLTWSQSLNVNLFHKQTWVEKKNGKWEESESEFTFHLLGCQVCVLWRCLKNCTLHCKPFSTQKKKSFVSLHLKCGVAFDWELSVNMRNTLNTHWIQISNIFSSALRSHLRDAFFPSFTFRQSKAMGCHLMRKLGITRERVGGVRLECNGCWEWVWRWQL